MIKRASLTAAVAVFVAVAVLSGCGGPSETTSAGASETTSASPSETTSATQTGAPVEHSTNSTSSDQALDEYVAEAQRQVRSSFGSFNGAYSKIRIKAVHPNGIKYLYVFSKSVDPSRAAEQLDTMAPTLRTMFKTVIAPALQAQGFAHPTATFAYFNPDGSRLWARTFSLS